MFEPQTKKEGKIWEEAENFGVDTSQLRDNLSLSREKRVLKHRQALKIFNECLMAHQKLYGRIYPAHQKTQSSSN